MMTVYLDVVMGLNFLVDFLLLLGTNRLAGFPPEAGRAALAATLGAAYAGVCMIPGLYFLGNTLWRLVFLALMGLIAFGMNRSALKRTGIFSLVSMAMGGIALGFERQEAPFLLLAALCVWLLCRIGFGDRVGGREYIPVQITLGQRQVSVIALKDTGNSLRDPITGEQVLVLGPEAGEKLLQLTQQQLSNPLDTVMNHPALGLRLVPYHGVSGGGLLLARRFSQVKIGSRRSSALVAFAPARIGTGEQYQALAGGLT